MKLFSNGISDLNAPFPKFISYCLFKSVNQYLMDFTANSYHIFFCIYKIEIVELNYILSVLDKNGMLSFSDTSDSNTVKHLF